MAVAKMKYLNLYGPDRLLEETLLAVARSELFVPEKTEPLIAPIETNTNIYDAPLKKAKGLLKDLGHSSMAADFVGDINTYDLGSVAEYLESFAAELSARNAKKVEIENKLDLEKKTEALLSHMANLDINIDELFTVKYLKVRVGRLPKDGYIRLQYYADKGFNFTTDFHFIVYDFDGEYYWGLYFAPADGIVEIEEIMKSLYFERIWVPEFVHGRPGDALERIHKEREELEAELDRINSLADVVTEEQLEKIQNMTAWLSVMNQLYTMNRYAIVFNGTFYLSGFVPVVDAARFEASFEDLRVVHIKEADKGEAVPAEPPVSLHNHWFARPYEMFTKMYGLPTYKGIDPTFIISVLYSVLYGLMFADLGQGLVLGIVGYFFMFKSKHLEIGSILSRCAIFSCIFGFLFGSVFGYEDLLDPIFEAIGIPWLPFRVMHGDNITLILMASLAIGAGVVVMAICINIAQNLQVKNFGAAVTSQNGMAGLVFYVCIFLLVLDTMALHTGLFAGPVFIVCGIVAPLLLMYLQEPLAVWMNGGGLHFHNPGDILLSGFFEIFVTVLEYLSNTVSFLRVGGFVLAHAGMMSVVMTLANMAGSLAPLVVAIGNIFVICLEGLLVAIQALRLNYYEVFSRFYDPDGAPYEPLRLQSDTVEF